MSYVKSRRPDLTDPWGSPYLFAKSHELKETPWVGAVGISREGPVWHAWFVESVEGDLISECNFIAGECSTRKLSDVSGIVGFY